MRNFFTCYLTSTIRCAGPAQEVVILYIPKENWQVEGWGGGNKELVVGDKYKEGLHIPTILMILFTKH